MISLIIPTFKRTDKLIDTLKSVQSFSQQVEIIVIDDNGKGTDFQKKTKSIIDKFPNIKYHALENNSGASAARNVGVEIAKNKYISFLDSDDLFVNEKIARELEVIKTHAPDFIYSKCKNHGKIINRKFKSKNIFKAQMIKTICTTSNLTIKKSIFNEIDGFRNIPSSQEGDLILRLLTNKQNLKVHFINEVLVERPLNEDFSISSETMSGISSYLVVRKPYFDRVPSIIKLFIFSTISKNLILSEKKYLKFILIILHLPALIIFAFSRMYLWFIR